MTESECVAELFKLYEKLTKKLTPYITPFIIQSWHNGKNY